MSLKLVHRQIAALKWRDFLRRINRQTVAWHDEIFSWAEGFNEHQLPTGLFEDVLSRFRGRCTNLSSLRFLVHLPPVEVSPGGFSLFGNLVQGLNFVGVPARSLEWDQPIESVLRDFQPNVLLTSDSSTYLEKIDWPSLQQYRRKRYLKLALTASLEQYGNTPLQQRLNWAENNGVDFYYSFRCQEYLHERPEYAAFYDAGYKILSVEFGANPLVYYPLNGIERDIPYVFLASSNPDKWCRYFKYLPTVLSKYPGFINGPGWSWSKKSAPPSLHRRLYARALVGINLHLSDSIEWASELNERTYILAACGVPQVVDSALLLPERFSKDAFFVARTPKEYVEQFEYALSDRKEAERRASIAMKEVLEKHTCFHRAESFARQVFEIF